MAKPKEHVTYYSRSTNLVISAIKGEQVLQDGKLVRFGEKIITFFDQGDGFGRYSTDDPELIEFLEERRTTAGDILTAREYNEQTTPLEIRLQSRDRELSEANRLIEKLQAQVAAQGSGTAPKGDRVAAVRE